MFQKSMPTDAQVSLYAVMFGSSYGLPNPSCPPAAPMPPVRYNLFRTRLSQMRSPAARRAGSFSSAATSAIPEYMYIARTAWPTGSVWSITGACAWLYSRPRGFTVSPGGGGPGPRWSSRNFARFRYCSLPVTR